MGGCGTNTAALCVGGSAGPDFLTVVEKWNGTSWTEVGDLNTGRRSLGAAGTNAAAVAFGGTNPTTYLGLTESWDDSSWTEAADLATARYYLTGLGTSSLALAAGGIKTGAAHGNDTEEWSFVADIETVAFD